MLALSSSQAPVLLPVPPAQWKREFLQNIDPESEGQRITDSDADRVHPFRRELSARHRHELSYRIQVRYRPFSGCPPFLILNF